MGIKLKLDAIKGNTHGDTHTPVQNTNSEKTEVGQVSAKKTRVPKPEKKKSTKISLSEIKQDKKTEPKENIVEVSSEGETTFEIGASCPLNSIELFPAYTSKFKKKQGNLLQEIKILKRLPKTNKTFIITLVGLTCMGIASLFIFLPETHNFDHYKTSIYEVAEQVSGPEDTQNKQEIIITEIAPVAIVSQTGSIQEGDDNQDELKVPVVIDNIGTGGLDTETPASFTGSSNVLAEDSAEYYQQIKEKILNK
ncbi:hypothetical protein MK079_05560 [Candidatus Gracilibacteria bacterium]|nr:hypothetical protein [Candidatus Gracilibacteria bacterium]